MKRPQRSPEKPLTGKGFWPADGKGFRPVDGKPQGRNGWIETLLYLDGWQTHRCLLKINIHFQCLLSYPLCHEQTFFFFFSALYTTTNDQQYNHMSSNQGQIGILLCPCESWWTQTCYLTSHASVSLHGKKKYWQLPHLGGCWNW